MYDLLVRARRIVCPATGLETSGAVAVVGDRIVAVGSDVDGPAKQTLDFPDETLLPGLVDLHAHPARSGSKYGVDPDVEFLPRGVTTVMSCRWPVPIHGSLVMTMSPGFHSGTGRALRTCRTVLGIVPMKAGMLRELSARANPLASMIVQE